MSYDKVKEQIARYLNKTAHEWNLLLKLYDELPDESEKYGKQNWLRYADDLLSNIPDIKEALELSELKKQGNLVVKADDQSLPTRIGIIFYDGDYAYKLAQQDMINAGWVKTERKEA